MAETVAVVGGGIAGLAAAWELARPGAGGAGPSVVVLEAEPQVGGKLRSATFGGRPVDVGPDGFLGRRPEVVDLCRELGAGDDLVPVDASGAQVWARGRRRTLPKAMVLGVPTRLLPTARSGILGPAGTLRLAMDVAAPRRDLRGPLGDRAVGPLVARKLGRRTVDRLVDPLVGGIHAGGVADMSAAAVFPALLAAVQRRGSLMRALRRGAGIPSAGSPPAGSPPAGSPPPDGPPPDGPPPDGPLFWTLRAGVGSLPERLATALRARGVVVRVGTPVTALEQAGGGWLVHAGGQRLAVDGVVLAVPAPRAAELLAPHDAEAATVLRGIDHASVAVVTLAYPDGAVPAGLVGTGLLVPRRTPAPPDLGGEHLVTACTYLDAKWPHLGRPGGRLLRASVGHAGDDRPAAMDDGELVRRVAAELRVLLGTTGEPDEAAVTRWPDAFPQYRVHHLLRVTAVEAAVKRLPPLAVAGAAYRGVGLPACVASGRTAAREVLASLSPRAGHGEPVP